MGCDRDDGASCEGSNGGGGGGGGGGGRGGGGRGGGGSIDWDGPINYIGSGKTEVDVVVGAVGGGISGGGGRNCAVDPDNGEAEADEEEDCCNAFVCECG